MDILRQFSDQIDAISIMLILINALVHILFSAAVARDAGKLQKHDQPIELVSGVTWAFATLVGGVVVASIYWAIHHLKIPRV